MINFLKRIFMLGNPDIKGELVYGKKKGESKPCYIPFSKNSGDKPVIATEQYVNSVSNSEKSVYIQQSSSTKIEAKGFRDFNTPCANAKIGDYVLVTVVGEPNFAEFTLTGFVSKDGFVTMRMQNITDKTAEFPKSRFNYKLIKY